VVTTWFADAIDAIRQATSASAILVCVFMY
jgi:hypothetical protein